MRLELYLEGTDQYSQGWNDATRAMATADVVEVVRCKDCKHWDEEFEECDCPNLGRRVQVPAGFYCGWGERREDGEEIR